MPYTRSFPEGGMQDTFADLSGGESKYSDLPVFLKDSEIRRIFSKTTEGRKIHQTAKGHWVIPQVSARGCGMACVAMLAYPTLLKHHKPLPPLLLQKNLTNEKQEQTALERLGCKTVVSQLDPENLLSSLSQKIKEHGSCLLNIDEPSSVQSHSIIVDAVDEEVALIRDPYHGWQIEVQTPTLLKIISVGNSVIQVDEKA